MNGEFDMSEKNEYALNVFHNKVCKIIYSEQPNTKPLIVTGKIVTINPSYIVMKNKSGQAHFLNLERIIRISEYQDRNITVETNQEPS